MSDVSVKQFGSGWGWLLVNPDGSLKIASTPNQDNPLMGKRLGLAAGIPDSYNRRLGARVLFKNIKILRAEYAKISGIWSIGSALASGTKARSRIKSR